MRKVLPVVLIVFILLSINFSSVLIYASNQSNVEITPKLSIKGPKAKGKPSKAVATGILGEKPPPPERRWAVVIGISDYAGTENDIEYADDDALDMLTVLIEVYDYRRDHILLLISNYTVNNASRNEIISAIQWLVGRVESTLETDDEVVFFYSGHGARGVADDGDKERIDEGIVPYECTSESIIWDGELRELFSQINTTRVVFIFDSCYAGGITDLKAPGRIVVMSTSENGVAYESSEWENGQFTYYFVDQGIHQGKADIYDHDGDEEYGESNDVTIEEAFDYAKANCELQRPTISDLFENDLLL